MKGKHILTLFAIIFCVAICFIVEKNNYSRWLYMWIILLSIFSWIKGAAFMGED